MRIARPDFHRVIDTREDLEDKWNDGLAPGIVLEFFLVVPEERRNIASTSKRSQYNQGAIIVEWWMLKDTCACPKPTWTSGKPLLQWRRQQADTWERWLIGNYAKIMDITVHWTVSNLSHDGEADPGPDLIGVVGAGAKVEETSQWVWVGHGDLGEANQSLSATRKWEKAAFVYLPLLRSSRSQVPRAEANQ